MKTCWQMTSLALKPSWHAKRDFTLHHSRSNFFFLLLHINQSIALYWNSFSNSPTLLSLGQDLYSNISIVTAEDWLHQVFGNNCSNTVVQYEIMLTTCHGYTSYYLIITSSRLLTLLWVKFVYMLCSGKTLTCSCMCYTIEWLFKWILYVSACLNIEWWRVWLLLQKCLHKSVCSFATSVITKSNNPNSKEVN